MKKVNLKKYIPYLLWSLVSVVCILSYAFTTMQKKENTCKGVVINILDNGNYFLNENDVEQMISMKVAQPDGKLLNEINTAVLEKCISANPFVAKAQVFLTVDGLMHVKLEQRNPVLRIMNTNGESYYVDESGRFMPVSDKYSANVVVANGMIDARYSNKAIELKEFAPDDTSNKNQITEQLFAVAKYLQSDTTLNALIEQIYVNGNNEMEMIPRIGNHVILFGDAGDMREKFEKLKIFYIKGLNKVGWTNYETINLKFKNQVVTTFKKEESKQLVIEPPTTNPPTENQKPI